MIIDLTGKIALVTGSNAGIGRQILETLAASGAKVAVNYLFGSSEETVEAVRQAGGEAYAFQADATNPAQLDNMVKEIEEHFGGTIDILVNNAGGMVNRVPNTEMDEEHYNKVMDVNFKSCVFACKAVAPGMIAKKRGKIINVSSLAAHDGGGPGASVYAASKAAVWSYTKGLAKELGSHGINVNAISPGFIGQTAFHATFTPDAVRQATIDKIPLGREGVPQDVSNVTLFLASELSDYLTGEIIEINGGMSMR
ncbi:SDR family NAD(P)-dependent oxidoreductase [Paenibacillus sp. URB8-2]|uniref:SDR family NAD(P)-dependent oxidoreductase n=1 Tax=Paenibacillus sp. URB8-2 TaxID=2741301 RepID=UPI0015B884E7|nr:3-oxoacyl-ACP reductase family protein [Paenibacillus sp. URB8-2]BCG60351.1 3-oxoacyl-ACP reductase [Paenibacillus sp. URB8-2]